MELLTKVSLLENEDTIISHFNQGLNDLMDSSEFEIVQRSPKNKTAIQIETSQNQFGFLCPITSHNLQNGDHQLLVNAAKMLAVILENQRHKNELKQAFSDTNSNNSLRKEVDLFNRFFETIPAHMYMKDVHSRFVKVNSSMRNLLKLSNESDIIGKDDFDFFDVEHAQPAYDDEQQIMSTGIPKVGYEEKETWPDGTVTWALSSKMPIYGPNGRIAGLVGLSQDITRLKEMEAELKKKNKDLKIALEKVRKGEELKEALKKLKETQVQLVHSEKMASVGMLVAGVAHEMNNPLNFIKGAKDAIAQYLDEYLKSHKEPLGNFLQIIDEGVTRASLIVKGLNRFNRKSNNYNESCDIHFIIDNCLYMLKGEIKSRIEVVKHFTKEPLTIKGNEGEIHQAILNIVNNAAQAIPFKGIISINTKKVNKELIIEIKDNGTGINKEDLEKISEPFFTTKEPGKGTGLGTTIAATIIDNHQGKIAYTSEAGVGTTVTVSLPVIEF